MAEKECIERDAAIRIASGYCHPANIAEELSKLPAADVRPVVLCRDCKYWNRERISCEGLARCNTGENGIRYRSRYDFCSRGKKREES